MASRWKRRWRCIALESKTFWRPVTPNTIFVAADNPAKRKELEQSVIKTFYLANLSQPTEIQEVVNTLRSILEIQKVQPLPSQGAIVVRGTPDQIAWREKLIDDLDKSKPEVVVEVAIMQISQRQEAQPWASIRPWGPTVSATVSLQDNLTNSTSSRDYFYEFRNRYGGKTGSINLNRIGQFERHRFSGDHSQRHRYCAV